MSSAEGSTPNSSNSDTELDEEIRFLKQKLKGLEARKSKKKITGITKSSAETDQSNTVTAALPMKLNEKDSDVAPAPNGVIVKPDVEAPTVVSPTIQHSDPSNLCWSEMAFGPYAPSEWKDRLSRIESALKENKRPSLEVRYHPIGDLCDGTILSLMGNIHRSGDQLEKKHRKTIKFEIIPRSNEGCCSTTIPIQVVIVESGVKKKIFRKLATALRDNALVLVRGVVQMSKDSKPFLCINDALDHVVLIETIPPAPEVYGMNGTPITFPATANIQQFLDPFSDAWFCPSWSNDKEEELGRHVVAYRKSGGVIYIGLILRCIKPSTFQVDNACMKLSLQDLEKLKKCIEGIAQIQSPPLCAQEWNPNDSRSLPNNIAKRYDESFNSYFCTIDRAYYIVRIVVCPSKHPLHLRKESDIKLHIRHGGGSSSFYPANDFVLKMSTSSAEVLQDIEAMSTASPKVACAIAIEDSNSVKLWEELDTESGSIENKERGEGDLVDYVIEKLKKYGATWLNGTMNGTLRIGVKNQPPLVTGVWFNEENEELLKRKISVRFKGSLESDKFCFPSALKKFSFKKHRIIANSNQLLYKGSDLIVVWLKKPPNSSGIDAVRLTLAKQIRSFNLLVLPLNEKKISGLSPPRGEMFAVGLAPVQSALKDFDEEIIKKLPDFQLFALPKICEDILDPNYCVLEITVSPSGRDILSLCHLPTFWQLHASANDEEDHIGKSPVQMSFQDIVLRCEGGSLAKDYLRRFFDSTDRPVLITDVGNLSQIKGFASIPWTMVIDFDFSNSESNTLKEFTLVNSQSYYDICNLPLNKDFPVNQADMMSKAPVYWVKALGPPNDPMRDPQEWRIQLLPEISKYIKQIPSLATNVKVLVVWSTQKASSTFGVVVAELCLAAQQAAHPWRKTEIAVLSPAIVSPFLDDFKSGKIRDANVYSMTLESLSEFLHLQFNFADKDLSTSSQGQRVPMEIMKRMKASKLDYLFPGKEDYLDMHNYDHGLAFFEGREIVRWEDFYANNVIERPETTSLKDSVDKLLRQRRNTAVVKNLYHRPGAGGSTIARHVMWLLKSSHCCVVPSQVHPNLRDDIMALISARPTESAAALVLWDANLGIDFDTLKTKIDDLHVVILRVQRVEKFSDCVPKTDLILEDGLSQTMLDAFVSLFCRNINLSKKSNDLNWLKEYAKRTKDRVPLFHVMVTVLENKFIPLAEYVKKRLVNITEAQRLALLRIAFARLFTSHPLQVHAVSDGADWEKSLSSSVSGLIAFDGQKQQNYRVRMRHHLIDEQILLQLGDTWKKQTTGPWEVEFVIDFIGHLYKVYQNQIIDSSGNNEFEIILRRLFHDKSDTESMQFPSFLYAIDNSGGKIVVIKCIEKVIRKLTPNKRICAHLLADLARVHLHLKFEDTDTNLKPAKEKMREAHTLLSNDRTLYHQEGQLYFDAISCIQLHSLSVKPPLECATEIINLAKQASECFKISRECEMHGRSNWQYPWISDVNCYIACFKSVYKILNCSFSTLPRSLAEDSYISNAMEDASALLDRLSTKDTDSTFHEKSRSKVLELLGTKEEHETNLTKLFKEIDGGRSLRDEPKSTYPGYFTNLELLAKTLLRASKLLRLMYQSAALVPTNLCTRLTLAAMWLIKQDRYIGTVFTCTGRQERFFELQLIWEWSRYSKNPPLRKGLRDFIDRFLPNMAPDSLLRAKCLRFKCATMLQQLLCDDDISVTPSSIRVLITECIICSNKNNLHEREFFINGRGKGLLSLKDWPITIYSLDEDVNKYSTELDLKQFSGCVQNNKFVNCKGLSFFFERHTAPPNMWKVNERVKFFVSFSSHKGLRAHPVFPEEYLKQRPIIHRWDWRSRQQGRIVSIDEEKGLLFFEPLVQSYDELARGAIDDIRDTGGVIPPPSIGDLYEFNVSRRVKNTMESFSIAHDLQFVSACSEDSSVSN